MIGLLRLVTEHEEAVEADLRRYYGVRLADVWAGRESLRHVGVLLRHLPPDAALVAVLPEPEGHGRPTVPPRWGYTEWILADLADILQGANWQRGGGGHRRPDPYPRPSDVRRRAAHAPMTREQADRLLALRPERNDP